MTIYEDECISIDLPEGWKISRDGTGISIVPGRGRLFTIGFCVTDVWTPQEYYDHFHQQFTTGPDTQSVGKKQWHREIVDPFKAGDYEGFRIKSFTDGKLNLEEGFFLHQACVIMVMVSKPRSEEETQFWQAFGTMKLPEDMIEQLDKRLNEPEKTEHHLSAIDLAKPRKKQFKTWMDHQMVLLMDSDSYPEDGADALMEGIDFVMPCNDKALWLSSLTEFDVTLEFVVRATVPKPRKVWWQREAEATLSIPTGKLHVEQTAGGLMMEIELQPGNYRVITRGSYPPDADVSQEGVEKIQVVLVPVSDDSSSQ